MDITVFRSALLRYFTDQELLRIRSATIGIAGLGGLGSNCALSLVRCGFERFVVADFDRVEASNLNRQAYMPEQVGRLKTECLCELAMKINPALSVSAHALRVGASNVAALFGACDVVVEAFDGPESKAMIVEAFIGSQKLVVGASGLGGYGDSDRIVTRKIRDNFYLIGDAVSEVNDCCKPYAPCVAIAAAKEADVVLSWVLGRGQCGVSSKAPGN